MNTKSYYEREGRRENIPTGMIAQNDSVSWFKKAFLFIELVLFCLLTVRIDYLRQPGYLARYWKFYGVWVVFYLGLFALAQLHSWGGLSHSWFPLILFLICWFYYYAAFTWFMGSQWRLALLQRFGKAKMIKYSEFIICTIWGSGALSFYAMSTAYQSLFPSPYDWGMASPLVLNIIGYSLIFVGLSFKVWPTWLIGYNSYFWRDQILGVPNKNFVDSSLYRWFKHPTYSVGYLQAYGTALLLHSTAGLLGALFMHIGIFIFVYCAEEPGIKRLYG